MQTHASHTHARVCACARVSVRGRVRARVSVCACERAWAHGRRCACEEKIYGPSWRTRLTTMPILVLNLGYAGNSCWHHRLSAHAGLEAHQVITLQKPSGLGILGGVNRKSLKLRLRIGFRYVDLVSMPETFLGLSLEF